MRTAMITGATGAIGSAVAAGIAGMDSYQVVLVCRDEVRASRTLEKIVRSSGNQRVSYELVDLSSQASIQSLAQRNRDPLHVLVNNAVTAPPHRMETDQGIEMQFATNVLGYFWMTEAFREQLASSGQGRVVNVASNYAGDLDLDDLEFKRRRYDNHTAYRQSKQANRMLTAAFTERLRPFGITINACHPGVVNSRLTRDMRTSGPDTGEQGARTPVWLATNPDLVEHTGGYYVRLQQTSDRFTRDEAALERLYEICCQY